MRNLTCLFGCFLAFALPNVAYSTGPAPDNRYDDGITLTISSKPFDAKTHTIEWCEEGKVCTVDGSFIYGGNGKIPKEQVNSLVFERNGKKLALDVSLMHDSGTNNINIKKHVKVIKWDTDAYWVVGYFSRGDDTYICQWLVSPQGSVRHYIGGYETLVTLTTMVQKDHGLDVTTGTEDSNK